MCGASDYDNFTNVIDVRKHLRKKIDNDFEPKLIHRCAASARAEGRAVAIMIWRSTTLRGRLTLWYTGILTATFAVLGTTSVLCSTVPAAKRR
jgi:hypothetical protein